MKIRLECCGKTESVDWVIDNIPRVVEKKDGVICVGQEHQYKREDLVLLLGEEKVKQLSSASMLAEKGGEEEKIPLTKTSNVKAVAESQPKTATAVAEEGKEGKLIGQCGICQQYGKKAVLGLACPHTYCEDCINNGSTRIISRVLDKASLWCEICFGCRYICKSI